jgi:nucleoside phosphorylase
VFDAIFVPRGAEERAVRRALRRRVLKGGAVQGAAAPAVWTSGIGPAAAARAVDEALAKAAPGTALVTGLCGSLSEAFAVGEILVYATVTRADGAVMSCDAALSAEMARRLGRAQTGIAAYNSDSLVARSADKRSLAARLGVGAVDMESFAFIAGLQRAGTRVAVMRVASDGVDDDLPDFSAGIDTKGALRPRALALAMFANPIAGARMAVNGVRALHELERAVGGVI